ncbi:MAG: Gfo/Idh/MocA family oxidoreductase, partial [Oscillospiraceae bacterium]|nr:Gfo/Idh/MocA family oxidoreductase [Oscillospiraceae bacterium]
MGNKIKYGMVGGGIGAFIGGVHHNAMNFDPRAELVAGFYSIVPEENAATADMYGTAGDRLYSDYKTMAEKESARPDGVDFVSITTPNATHYEIAKEFLSKGINVVCEKPLCFEIGQAEELVKLARDKNLVFAVTYTYPGYVMAKVMREMIAEGKIGNVVNVNAEYIQDWLLDELSPENKSKLNLSVWRTDPKQSGISNCVGDIGTHIEAFVHYVTGLKIKRLCATTNKFGHALDLNANMIVEYDNGANGAYWCSQIAAGHLNGLTVRVFGDKGSLEWEQHFPDYLRYTPKGGATQTLSRGCGYLTEKAASLSRLPSGHPEGLTIAFANHYRNIITT